MTTRRLRALARTLATTLIGVSVFTACPDPAPLPLAGWAEFQDLLFVRVPGGSVNTGGGNFYTRRTDLSIDTRVGTYAIGAAYNSASGGWRWAHEMTYAGSTFVDETGASFNLTNVAIGTAIAGTHWVRLDADSMKTKGGLVHDFSASGKLAAIHWLGFDYPRLRFTSQLVGGIERVTTIDQCTAAATCLNFFTLGYTASAQLQTVTDRASRVASFTWDASGRLATAKDGLDTAKGWLGFRYEYSGTNLTAITNSENERVEYTYDTSARLLTAKKIGDENPTSTFAYFGTQPNGYYLTRLTNPLSQITNFSYDGWRRLFSLQLAAVGETTSFQWLGSRVTRITRPDGVQTNFVITDDDVTQVTEASGNVTNITYAPSAIDPGSPNARPVDVVSDSVGALLDRGYDLQGRLISQANGASDTTEYAWQLGSPTALASLTSALGVVTSYGSQGDHGHPASATTGSYLTKPFTYDLVGNMLNGQSTATELSPGMGGVVSRTFDSDRNIATVVLKSQVPNEDDETMTLETRSDGLLKAIRPPYGGDTEFDYTATGRVLFRREKANAAWVATSFGYDALDRMTFTELANGMRSEMGYDGAGRVNAVTSKRSGAVEGTLSRTFAAGRLTGSTDSAFTGSESYAYDSAGRVSTITYPGGERRELVHDLRSRVTVERFVDASDATLVELLYTYDLANRITEIRRGPLNVLVLKYTYTNGFLAQTDYQNGLRRTATPNLDFGLPGTTTTTNAQAETVEDTFNDLNAFLITKSSTIGGTALPWEIFSTGSEWRLNTSPPGDQFWKWDAASNARQAGGQELLYNPEVNRLTQMRDVAAPQTVRHTYGYDAAGFATNRDGVALGYDATGAIASIGTVAAFDHDLSGRPVSRTLNGTTKLFRFGGAIAYSTAGSPIEMDLGEVVLKLDASGNRFRHMDFRGNVQFVSKGNTIEGHASYRGFGRLSASGNLGERGFAGGFEIPSLGLVVLGPRVLDSDAGRFLSQDPLFNQVNLYTYGQGNPVFFWDPGGRRTEAQSGAATGMSLGGGILAAGAAKAGGATAGWTGAAFIAGAVYGLAIYNFIAIAVDPDGSSRVTPQEAYDFVSQFTIEPIRGNEGPGGGSGISEKNIPIGAVPGIGDEVVEEVSFSLGSLNFAISLSFGFSFY